MHTPATQLHLPANLFRWRNLPSLQEPSCGSLLPFLWTVQAARKTQTNGPTPASRSSPKETDNFNAMKSTPSVQWLYAHPRTPVHMNANFDQHVHYHHTVIPTEVEGSAVAFRVFFLRTEALFSGEKTCLNKVERELHHPPAKNIPKASMLFTPKRAQSPYAHPLPTPIQQSRTGKKPVSSCHIAPTPPPCFAPPQ